MTIADAIRLVTAKVQKELDSGNSSAQINANDVIEILLAIADATESN